MTAIPANYIRITSGLGDASPSALLIVPLKMNDEVHGMLELASFNQYQPYEIELIEKLAETIASTIATVRVNERTRELLEQSQQSAEEMRAQEEEMRQNMEELTATQEEIRRNGIEMESRMQAINDSGIASIEFDLRGNVIAANDAFLKLMGYTFPEINGKHHQMFVKPEYARSREYEKFWRDLAEGIAQPGEFERMRKDGQKVFIYGSYSIVRNADGKPKRVLKLANDVTETRLQMMRLHEQEEEMRQNMEELTATQDGMEKIIEDVKQKEDYLHSLINVSSETIITIDKNYQLISFNDKFARDMQGLGLMAAPGFSMLQFYTTDVEIAKAKAQYDRAFAGENFEDSVEYEMGGNLVHLVMNYAPLRNVKGEIYAVALFTKNVTELTEAKRRAEKLLASMQNLN
jgi:methyl-accepting chemotaxis protein